MVARVALVKTGDDVGQAYKHALNLIGGLDDLASGSSFVTIKVGIYDPRNLNYPTTTAVKAVIDSFPSKRRILLAESDNHQGSALDRLQCWSEVFSERVSPFDLSHDRDTREVQVCGEKLAFSHVLFKPNVLVSLHVLREGTAGCIFKNLLGLVPDIGKERFHGKMGEALVDMAQAVGGIDLSVIDGTYCYGTEWKEGEPLERERRDLLAVGRDPVAVEVIGCILAGGDPLSVPQIAVAKQRRLGEADPARIEVLGEAIEDLLQ